MKNLIKITLWCVVLQFSSAQALECNIVNPSDYAWIVAIHINESNGEITLTESEAQGKKVYKTKLIDVSSDRYTFNLSPQENSGVTNMFLLFKTFGRWRLLDVGVEEKSGTTVLRAVGESNEYKCVKK
jgi:hypothetical protein